MIPKLIGPQNPEHLSGLVLLRTHAALQYHLKKHNTIHIIPAPSTEQQQKSLPNINLLASITPRQFKTFKTALSEEGEGKKKKKTALS